MLLRPVEREREAGLLTVRSAALEHACLHGLVDGGDRLFQGDGRVGLLLRDSAAEFLLERLETGLDVVVGDLFAGTGAYALFG